MNWGFIPQDEMVMVNQLLDDLKTHDEATYSHCLRVSQLCRFLAEAAGLSPEQQTLAQFAGLLHDVGKTQTNGAVLNKPARLNDNEFREMKQHPVASAELLEPLAENPFFRDVQSAVLHHHERVDGNGYPNALLGDQIPLISRLILIVDTVDAMTQDRPYRKGLPMEVAYRELERCAGTQFDAEFTEIFIAAHRQLHAIDQFNKVLQLPGKVSEAA